MGTFTFSTTAELGGFFDHTLGNWDQAELSAGKYIAVYQQSTPVRYFARVVNLVDDVTSPTYGTQQTVESTPATSQHLFVVALSSSKAVVMYHNSVDSKLTMRVLNVDGSDNITVGTAAAFTLTFQPDLRFKTGGRKRLDAVGIDSSNFYLWHNNSNSNGSTWVLSKFNVSGDTITQSGSSLDSRTLMGGSWNFEQDRIGSNYTWKISKGLAVGGLELDTATTWNPADSAVSLSGGNLTATNTIGGNTRFGVRSIFSSSTGKYYWETVQSAQFTTIGIAQSTWPLGLSNSESFGPQITYYNFSGGIFVIGGGGVLGGSWVNTTYANGDVISVAVDFDNGKIWFGKNGTWLNVTAQTDPENGLNPAVTFASATWFGAAISQHLGANSVATSNFGATAFTHPTLVPTGFIPGLGTSSDASEFIIQSSKSVGVIDNDFTKVIDLSDINLASSSGIAFELAINEYIFMEDDQKLQVNTGGVWGRDVDFSATNSSKVKDIIRIDDTHFGVVQVDSAATDQYLQFVRRFNDELWQHQINSILSTPFPEQGFDIFTSGVTTGNWWQGLGRTGEIGEMIYTIDTENFVVFHAPTSATFEMTVVNQPQPVVGPDLPTLNNLTAHYDATNTASLTLSGSDVLTWGDLSGNGNDQTSGGGTKPTLEVGVANGFDCIRFTSSAFTGTTWPGGDCTVTMVLKYNPAALAAVQFSIAVGFGGNLSLGQWDQSSAKEAFGFNTLSGDAFGNNDGKEVLTQDYTVVTVYCDSGNITSGMRLFFNDVEKAVSQVAGTTANGTSVITPFDIGDVGAAGFPMRGDICEVYLNSELLSDDDNLQLITFLKDKWAIPDLERVGSNIVSASSGNLSFPFDTQEGDLAVVLFVEGTATPTVIGSGWTFMDSASGVLTGSSYSIYSKTLVQADIDTPVAFTTSNGGFNLVVYRGHNTITFKQQKNSPGATTVPGFTKDPSSARILAFYVDRDPIISTDPTGFTEFDNSNITFFNMAASDILSVNYTDNTSIAWTPGGAGSGFGEAISVLEIT